jgi:hypothetical protein
MDEIHTKSHINIMLRGTSQRLQALRRTRRRHSEATKKGELTNPTRRRRIDIHPPKLDNATSHRHVSTPPYSNYSQDNTPPTSNPTAETETADTTTGDSLYDPLHETRQQTHNQHIHRRLRRRNNHASTEDMFIKPLSFETC